jgi:hypothetical protein
MTRLAGRVALVTEAAGERPLSPSKGPERVDPLGVLQ